MTLVMEESPEEEIMELDLNKPWPNKSELTPEINHPKQEKRQFITVIN